MNVDPPPPPSLPPPFPPSFPFLTLLPPFSARGARHCFGLRPASVGISKVMAAAKALSRRNTTCEVPRCRGGMSSRQYTGERVWCVRDVREHTQENSNTYIQEHTHTHTHTHTQTHTNTQTHRHMNTDAYIHTYIHTHTHTHTHTLTHTQYSQQSKQTDTLQSLVESDAPGRRTLYTQLLGVQ